MILAGLEFWALRPPTPAVPTESASPGSLLIVAAPADSELVELPVSQGSARGQGSLVLRRRDHPVQISRQGYETRILEPEEIKDLSGPVRLRRTGAGFLLHHWPAWALFALLGWAWRSRPRPIVDERPEIGGYRLNGLAGRGGMAEVYRADAPDGRCVALKLMRPEGTEGEDFATRFQREAEICEGLTHPGLVRVFSSGCHEGRWWMAQEWIDGTSLDKLPLPLEPARVASLLKRICRGLEYAHAHGIVHRDLKPANIMLRTDGVPVIADFGLARGAHYQTITKTDVALGTPAYMPPEQIRSERSSPQADLYSLGCIAYQLLTGRLPFTGSDPIKVLLAHLGQEPPAAGVSPEWDSLLADLLQKEPERRPSGAAEVLARLEAIHPEA